MALGARGEDVLRDVLARGGSLVAAGLVIGLACALAAARLVSSLLAEVPPHDPVTFFGVVLVLGFAGLLAAYLPARRAARIDPMQALREE
jgi:ABC-type antimicrobial peptide transport system permease subunit